ncbi:MAG TPA: hypothetical protein VNJ07_00595 [Chitinophagales bacterium]|nr:hypothetical protein [Chitinophagales bacterium]
MRNQRETVTYHNASTIGLLFDGTKQENMEPAKRYHQFLRSQNKKVHLLCYIEKERPGESLPFDYLTKKNLNWCFIPEHPKADDFINNRFDLLINLSTHDCLPLEYISSLAKSKLRIGRFIPEKTFCNDLMIDLKGNNDVNYLISQVEHYLRMIR